MVNKSSKVNFTHLLGGIFFIFRLIVLQLVLVSLYTLPQIALAILVSLEVVYLNLIFAKLRKGLFLKSWLIFFSKLFHSCTLLLYYASVLYPSLTQGPGSSIEAPMLIQQIGLLVLVLNILGGSILAVVKLLVTIITLVRVRMNRKNA